MAEDTDKDGQKEIKLLPITGGITTEEFKQAFRKAKENTSSSLSGLDYTVWKCIASDDTMAEVFAIMMSLPLNYGFVNNRWCQATDVMLEKKQGKRKIHRLRTIGLMEADFNTALKLLFAKKMMDNAERSGISGEQWGGRPNRTALDTAVRKIVDTRLCKVNIRNSGNFCK